MSCREHRPVWRKMSLDVHDDLDTLDGLDDLVQLAFKVDLDHLGIANIGEATLGAWSDEQDELDLASALGREEILEGGGADPAERGKESNSVDHDACV